jgi:ABC-type sugar transport system substrate-binding protein
MVSLTNWALSQLEAIVDTTGGVALGAPAVADGGLVGGTRVAVVVADGAPEVSAARTVSAAAVCTAPVSWPGRLHARAGTIHARIRTHADV